MKLTLPSLFALSLSAYPVLAQEADTELRSDTIFVTAPGPERSAGELISYATQLERTDIVEDLAGTLGDTLDRQPGVATTYFGAGASRPVLRGLGAERVLVLTNGLGAIDASAASPDHQSSGDGIDAEQIEILRGPAALAYGGQAIGGVINVLDGYIVDVLPEEGMSADGYAAYNSVNDGSELAARGQFVQGPLVFTLGASARDFDDYDIPGFADSSLLRAMEEEDDHHHDEEDHDEDHDEHEHEDEMSDTVENAFLKTQTFGAGVSYVGTKGFLGVSVRHTNSDYGLPGHDHAHGHEDEHDEDEDHDDHDHEDEDHDHDEEDHDHEDEHGEAFIELEHTRIDLKGGVFVGGETIKRVEFALSHADYEHIEFEGPGEPGTRYETDGLEGRVEIDHDIFGLSGAIGLQAFEKSFGAFGDEAFITPTDSDGLALFLYEARDWDDGFGLEGGLRFETVSYDNQTFGSADFDLMSASFGVHKHWDSGLFLGLQIGHTERAPNESELFADGPHLATDQYEVGDQTLSAEYALNVETTLRWEVDQTSVGASVFATSFEDFIYLEPTELEEDGLPVWRFMQQDADFHGFEIYGDHQFRATPLGAQWSVDGSLDFVSAELSDGKNVPYLPPLTFNGALSADWGLVNASLTTTLAADQDDPGEGTLPTDGYALFGLKAGVEVAQWLDVDQAIDLFVDVRNLTDEEVRYSTSVLKDTLPAPGRNVRFGVRAGF